MSIISEYLKKEGYDFSKPTKVQQYRAEREYGNLGKEIVNLNNTLTDLFTSGEWRDAPTMKGYSDSLSSTLGKVKGYKDYITKYHANDNGAADLLKVLSDTENYYTGATDNLNYLTGYYGGFTNAKSFADQKAKDDAKAAKLAEFQKLSTAADFADRSVFDESSAKDFYKTEGFRNGTSIDQAIFDSVVNDRDVGAMMYGYSTNSLTDEEKALYRYIAQTQGVSQARNYIDTISDTLNYRKGVEIADSWIGRDLPILTSFASGVDSAQQGLINAVNSLINPNKERPTSAMQYAGGLIGQREMEEGVVQGFAAQISQSIGQMTPQILVSLATGNVGGAAKGVASAASKILSMATLGASVYGNAYNEALQRGQDGWRAYGYGLGNAAVEIAAESFADGINLISSGSWGKALATKLTGNKFKAVTEIVAEIADKPRIKYLLDALGEGAEEVFSTALEPALESFFLKETFDPASVEEMLYSGLLGALTSGVMNAPGVPGQVANYKYYSGMNQTLNDADIDTIRAEAMQMGEKSKSYNAAKEFEGVETKDLANRHRRRILEAFDTENREKTNEIVGNAFARNYAESEKVKDNVDKAAEKAAEMKGKYNTATDGKAYTKDGTEADFSDFTETVEIDEEGNAVFTAKDGRTLSTADDVVPEIVAEGVAMLANLPSIPKSAYSTYFQYLPKQTNTKAYTRAFETLFEMGKNAEGMKLATSAAFADAELDELSQGDIYLQGVNTRKSADEAFKDAVAKARSAAEKNGKFNAKKGKLNDKAVRNMKLTRAQKNAITMLSSFTEFGINVEIYASTEANRKNTPNGWFDSTTGTIHLDINAGQNADVVGSGVFWTIAHESTHMIKVTAPEAYKVLQEYVIDEMFETEDALDKAIREEMMRHDLQHPNEPKMSRADAIEEIVARSCESIFADSDQLTKMLIEGEARKEGFAEKVIDILQKIVEKITAFFQTLSSEYNPESKEGKFFSETAERMLKLKELYDNAFAEAVEGAKVVYGTELTPGEEGVVVNEKGEPVAYSTKNGSVMLSMRTYREEGRDKFKKYLEKCVKAKTLTREETDEMLSDLDEIYRVCSEFKDKYAPFSKWSDAEIIRNEKGKAVFSVVTPNGDYKMNLDFSLVCKKRRALDAVFNEMARRGTIDNFELGQKTIVKINEIIRKYGFETACALCFVDAKRFRQGSMADQFVNLYNDLVKSLVPSDSVKRINYFNFSSNTLISDKENAIDTWSNSDLDFTHINKVLKEYESGTVEYKAAMYIKQNPEARKLVLRGDFMSSGGFDAVKTKNPKILSLYNSKKGTGGPKAAFGDVQYLNEVIEKARYWTPEKAYSVGGIRVQSFSGYIPRLVFDYVQMIYDLAATKLPAHSYTKEYLYALQYGLTGMKINLSLIPAIADDGIAPGLDKNGNYVWAGESFDFETAKRIQNADGYTENCGTICVGISDEHILKLLDDPEIRMVIPYHKSGLNPIVAHMNKIDKFDDFTYDQNTRKKADGKKVEKDFEFNKTLRKLNDPKAAAQAYLDWCEKNEYSPKFAEFSQHANYYKLLVDFTVYDKSGNYVPQRAVKAVFPKGEDAFGSMKELIEEGLEEDAIIEGKRDARLGDIVDEIERTIPKTEAEIAEEEVPQAETDVEARIMRSDRSRNIDRDILESVLADSSLKQRYFSQRVFLQKYQEAQTSYNKALTEINRIEKEIRELPRGNTQNSKVKRLRESLDFYYGRLQAAEEKMFTYEAEGLRDVIDSEINRLNEVARKTGIESRREAIHERVERASRAAEISTISNYVKKTLKLFEGDTKKQYVPEVLKAPIVEFLTFFDFTKAKTNGGVTQQSARLDDAVQALLSVDTEDFDKVIADFEQAVKDNSFGEETFAFDLNEDVVNALKERFESIKAEIKRFENLEPTQRNIYNMDAEALADLKDALRTIYTIVKQANTLIASGMSIADAANGTINHLADVEADTSKWSTAKRKAYFLFVDPIRFFEKLGKEAVEMFRQLQIAESRRAFLIKRVQDFMRNEIGVKNVEKWENEIHEIKGIPVLDKNGDIVVDDNGKPATKTIKVNATQIMALYCHWNREQSRKHLSSTNENGDKVKTGGGIFREKLDSGEFDESPRIRFTQEIVDAMTNELSKEQLNAAKAIQRYMSNELAELGNMVTMKRFGLNGFTEEYYIPIITKKNDSVNETGDKAPGELLRIINKPFTKKTQKVATSTIYIDNLFDVFTKHAMEMIDYHSFAIPLLDIVRWLNFSDTANGADITMKDALNKAFGTQGRQFITQLIKDINGSSSTPTGGIGIQKFFLRNVKVALVGGKLKQIFLQPTAIARANEVIKEKNINKAVGILLKTKGAEDNINNTYDRALKWSGVAVMKDMGYVDVNLGVGTFADIIKDGGESAWKKAVASLKTKDAKKIHEAITELSLEYMRIGDKLGWAILWRACEYEAIERFPKLAPKSDDYYKAVTRLFEDCVYKTQVFDSVLSKNAMLRSSDTLSRLSTSFMSERMKSLQGVIGVYQAYSDTRMRLEKAERAKQSDDEKGRKEAARIARKKAFEMYRADMLKATWKYAAASVVTAIVATVADAFADDEENWLDYKIYLKKFFGKNFFDGNLWGELDPLRRLPYISEVINIFQGYDPSRLDLESFAETQQAFNAMLNIMQGKGNYTGIGVIIQTLEAVALMTGLPVQNVAKDVKDLFNAIVSDVFGGYEATEKKK